MLTDPHSAAAKGLAQYLRLVARELGLDAAQGYYELDAPAGAYLDLQRRLAAFPTRNTALVWDEEHGWAVGVDSHSGLSLVVLSHLGERVLPPPEAVAAFVEAIFNGRWPGQARPSRLRRADAEDGLDAELAAYARVPVGHGRSEPVPA
ncbi:hypothetical protein SAMN05216266_101147 [Amycolatopsis marina]|uniref:DUF6292 domain-containing protein n=1 Tax=Amycolatopsis marina TaxID=490629 RepID=A0A1I0VCR0_9PSEU|nr:DUF6292 family protein [Amycolatopsis marina]SFA73837.1 hypothetical protein SAMN05216266_101147 [Amycolatopsis marina]